MVPACVTHRTMCYTRTALTARYSTARHDRRLRTCSAPSGFAVTGYSLMSRSIFGSVSPGVLYAQLVMPSLIDEVLVLESADNDSGVYA